MEVASSPASAAAAMKADTDLSPAFTPPEYTMKDIYDSIPPHCLHSNTLLSLCYVLRDFTFVSILIALATQIHHIRHPYLNFIAWATYSCLQGLVFTGLWEIAHESGHGALSKHKWVNNAIGMVVHSLLLVPFYSWRLTHAHHHKSTNNLERDIAFVPDTKEDWMAARKSRNSHFPAWELVEDTPIVALITLFFHQLIAWPIYLTINNFALPRMRVVPWYKRSHFYFGGDGPNFKPANRQDILISDLGIATMACLLWVSVDYFGAKKVALFYVLPYLQTNHWIRKLSLNTQILYGLTHNSHDNFSPAHGCLNTVLSV
jgi:omega-6 fatty acid desaturase (delta-12 desaturase)